MPTARKCCKRKTPSSSDYSESEGEGERHAHMYSGLFYKAYFILANKILALLRAYKNSHHFQLGQRLRVCLLTYRSIIKTFFSAGVHSADIYTRKSRKEDQRDEDELSGGVTVNVLLAQHLPSCSAI